MHGSVSFNMLDIVIWSTHEGIKKNYVEETNKDFTILSTWKFVVKLSYMPLAKIFFCLNA